MDWSKKMSKKKTCKNCKEEGHFKTIPLYEYGDPFIPSEIVLVCKRCGTDEAVATMGHEHEEDINKIRNDIDKIMGGKAK